MNMKFRHFFVCTLGGKPKDIEFESMNLGFTLRTMVSKTLKEERVIAFDGDHSQGSDGFWVGHLGELSTCTFLWLYFHHFSTLGQTT